MKKKEKIISTIFYILFVVSIIINVVWLIYFFDPCQRFGGKCTVNFATKLFTSSSNFDYSGVIIWIINILLYLFAIWYMIIAFKTNNKHKILKLIIGIISILFSMVLGNLIFNFVIEIINPDFYSNWYSLK